MKAEIKAHDLMLGNLLKYVNGENIFKVIGIHEFGIDCEDEIETTYMEYENFEPIPLTEEWLVRFGAEKRSLHYYKLNGIIICVQDFFFECYLGGINVHIKYVHTLQNLIYTLTNKHLTIK